MSIQFGKYLLQHKIAEGGMAEIYLAKQTGMAGFEKPVVVKRILPKLCGDPNFVEMFLNEARVAARLSHPSIVHIFDLGKAEETYFITMEFIHGEDLRAVAARREQMKQPVPLGVAARIFADVLGALHYAHTRTGPGGAPLGLVHRDISPPNVLVTYQGGVKLVDFGIAKATQSKSTLQTQSGMLKGKYAYMSPEQCNGRKIDARSDVFSVGILLWELISGQYLFRRDGDMATLIAVIDEPIPTLNQVRADVPPELERICARALERNIDRRYPSAQNMQFDLERLIREQAWEADSITLQNFMQESFAGKLQRQDQAMREAGVGNIEELIVSLDAGNNISCIKSHTGKTPPPGLAAPTGGVANVDAEEEMELDEAELSPLLEEISDEDDRDSFDEMRAEPTAVCQLPPELLAEAFGSAPTAMQPARASELWAEVPTAPGNNRELVAEVFGEVPTKPGKNINETTAVARLSSDTNTRPSLLLERETRPSQLPKTRSARLIRHPLFWVIAVLIVALAVGKYLILLME